MSSDTGNAASAAPATASAAVTPVGSDQSVAPTIAAGQDDGTSNASSQSRGPIPLDRHEAILKPKLQEIDRLTQKLRSVEWAERVDRDRAEKALRWYEAIDRDPVSVTHQLATALERHPEWSTQWKQRQSASQAQVGPEPEPDLIAENGTPVYSAPQLRKWNEWNTARQREATRNELMGLLNPLLARERAAKLEEQTTRYVNDWMSKLKEYPYFEETRPHMKEFLDADKRISPDTAYARAFAKYVKPKLAQMERDKLLAEMDNKAGASTANPASGSSTAKNPRDMSWSDALEWAAKKGAKR